MINHAAKLAENLVRGYELANSTMGITKDQSLCEASGWQEMVEDIGCPEKAAITALMLENYKQYRQGLDETSTTLQVGNFDKFAFPLISIVSENLVAQDLVSLQPLDGPTGQIFFMNFVTGQAKGDRPRGAKVWDARTAHADSYLDSADSVSNEVVGTTDANGDFSATNLAYGPVMPGTIIISDGTNTVYDDGAGKLLDNSDNATAGSVNYNTGEIVVDSNSSDLDALSAVTASYNYNSELNDTAQQIDFEIVSSPIQVQERKLRGRWSTEAAQALEALHKVNAENMVSTAIANHLQWEIDREIIEDLRRQAGAGVVTWDETVPTNSYISYTEHKLTMQDAAVKASSFILRATNRVSANWMLTGISGANIVKTLPNFEPAADKAEVQGVHKIGRWQGMDVYCDPHYRTDEALFGYKGNDFISTGYVFAPWILLFSTPNVVLDDFINRKGFASQYGKRMVNNKMYAKMKITNTTASFGG